MTMRETIITKLHNLPDSLLQQVSDFIDLVVLKEQNQVINSSSQKQVSEIWDEWFESVDRLSTTSTEPVSEYQELLLNKYRKQGLEL